MTEHEEATERAKRYERAAANYAKKAMEGDAGAAQLAQTFASLAVAARMQHMDWRMRVLGDQLGDVKKSMDLLRRKLPER
jgi:ubiquinone biosynthesis protein UbiJ